MARIQTLVAALVLCAGCSGRATPGRTEATRSDPPRTFPEASIVVCPRETSSGSTGDNGAQRTATLKIDAEELPAQSLIDKSLSELPVLCPLESVVRVLGQLPLSDSLIYRYSDIEGNDYIVSCVPTNEVPWTPIEGDQLRVFAVVKRPANNSTARLIYVYPPNLIGHRCTGAPGFPPFEDD